MANQMPAEGKATGPVIAALPVVDGPAPPSLEFKLPRSKPVLVVFLRQCGDPFAEKTFRSLAALSEDRPELTCIAVSQASREVTDLWVADIGGAWEVEVVADPERGLYARWGLGLNTSWQMFNPRALYATYALGRDEGIWSRAWGGHKKVPVPAESSASASTPSTTGTGSSAPGSSANGNKWQMGGAFAVDVAGGIRWVHVPNTSEDIVDFNPVLELFGMPPLPSKVVKKRPSPSPSPIPDGQRTLYQTPTPRDPPPRR